MARNIRSFLLTGTFTFSTTGAQEKFTTHPNPLYSAAGQPVTPPVTGAMLGKGDGYVRSVMARVNTGSGVTLSDLQVGLYRDLTSYPDGTDGVTLTAIPDDRKVYVSAVVASPTPSAVTADIDDRLSTLEPFYNGLWIACTCGGATGSGDTTVDYRIWLDLFSD